MTDKQPSKWYSTRIPAPLQRLFDRFPLVTYPPNDLPQRSPVPGDLPILHVFIAEDDAAKGSPSFNPSCLKWQTFLRIAGVHVRIVPSTNHSSPTGALPFLQPATPPSSPVNEPRPPVPSTKLHDYAVEHGTSKPAEVSSLRLEAYQSLLDHRIRNAWLYALYLSPANTALLDRLYVHPVSRSSAVRATLRHQLRRAAEAEIAKALPSGPWAAVDPDRVYAEAAEAFGALETLLGSEEWFFGSEGPSLFDAAVFAYTHLLLDPALAWEDGALRDMVAALPRIRGHQERIYARYWGQQVSESTVLV